MGGSCGTCGGEEKCLQRFGGKTFKERDHLEEVGVKGTMILNGH
jgi:hypothetical protein